MAARVGEMDSNKRKDRLRARSKENSGQQVLDYYNDLYGKKVAFDTAGVVREFLMDDPKRHTREAYEMASLL